jgi:predicted GNAT family acetyltransferase
MSAVFIKPFKELTPSEVVQLKRLTRTKGSMRAELSIGRKPHEKQEFTAVFYKVRNQIVAWWSVAKAPKGTVFVNAFTHHMYRGKGIAQDLGRCVITWVARQYGKGTQLVAYPYDDAGANLYKRLGYTPDPNGRTWSRLTSGAHT